MEVIRIGFGMFSFLRVAALLVVVLQPLSLMAAQEAFPPTQPGVSEVKVLPAGVLLKSTGSGNYFSESNRLFGPLFRYISTRDIARTTPVEAKIDQAAMYFWVAPSEADRQRGLGGSGADPGATRREPRGAGRLFPGKLCAHARRVARVDCDAARLGDRGRTLCGVLARTDHAVVCETLGGSRPRESEGEKLAVAFRRRSPPRHCSTACPPVSRARWVPSQRAVGE